MNGVEKRKFGVWRNKKKGGLGAGPVPGEHAQKRRQNAGGWEARKE